MTELVRREETRFDELTHTYRIGERKVPNVTQILSATLGEPWRASDWYLQRGRAVHACCALLARGLEFEHDPRIAGQVSACRSFLSDFQCEIREIEVPRFSTLFQFAGTPDLIITFDGRRCVVDYKASLSPMVEFQLGGYSELTGCKYGIGVELRAHGTYTTTGLKHLTEAKREFLALLATYKIFERLGRLPNEEES